MSHLRAVPDQPTPPPPSTPTAAVVVVETAPHPPGVCIRCGAATRVTTETRDPHGMHRTYLLCQNAHGMAVTWGENS